MMWTCDADGRREDTKENATHKMEEKQPEPKRMHQIYKEYKNERGKLERNTRKHEWENRDSPRFVCNSRPNLWKLLKNDDDYGIFNTNHTQS